MSNDKQTFGKHTEKLKQLGNNKNPDASLVDLLTAYPGMFPESMLAIIANAKSKDQLTDILNGFANDEYHSAWSIVKKYIAWPMIMLLVLITAMSVVSLFVIPSFREVYDSMGGSIPVLTETLFNLSDFFIKYWWALLIAIIPTAIIIGYKQSQVSKLFNRIIVFKYYNNHQFFLRLALWMMVAGNNKSLMIQLLHYLKDTSNSSSFHSCINEMEVNLNNSESIQIAFAKTNGIPQSLIYAINSQTSDEYSNDCMSLCQELLQTKVVQAGEKLGRIAFISTYIIAGILVALFVISVYLPIFSFGSAV